MIESNTYRGINYVRISALPEEQKLAIKNWMSPDLIIKIQTDKALLPDCILYNDYKHWFENIYTRAVTGEEVASTKLKKQVRPLRGLAFD